MVLLVVAVLIGLVAGFLRPPLGARAARPRLRRVPLVAVGAAGTALSSQVADDAATVALGLSLVVLLAFALSNSHVTGVLVIGAGLLLNLVAVVINDGMPVRGSALVAAEVVTAEELPGVELSGARHLEGSTDRLAVLGDVLPVRVTREVLSFGDLMVVAGAADALRELVRRRRRTWSASERATYESTATQLRAVHDWGTAPTAAPDSGSQHSANPDDTAPLTIDLTSSSRTGRARPLVAASDNK